MKSLRYVSIFPTYSRPSWWGLQPISQAILLETFPKEEHGMAMATWGTGIVFDPPYLKRKSLSIDYMGLVLLVAGIGCLQIVLDKGQRKDWFSSHFIVTLSIIAAMALILLVIRELLYKEPVINLRAFKDRSYATGTFIIFLYFFVFWEVLYFYRYTSKS